MLSQKEIALQIELHGLVWVEEISAEGLATIRHGLAAENHRVVEDAVILAAVHDVDEVAEELRKGLLRKGTLSWTFSKMVGEALEDQGACVNRLREKLGGKLPGDKYWQDRKRLTGGKRMVRELITSAVVLHELRAVRLGQKSKPDVVGLEPTDLEQRLIEYCTMKPQAVFEDIVPKLTNPQVLSMKEYELVSVMQTYGSAYLDYILDFLEGEPELSEYGELILLQSLRRRCRKLSDEDAERLSKILDEGYVSAKKPIPGLIDVLREELAARASTSEAQK